MLNIMKDLRSGRYRMTGFIAIVMTVSIVVAVLFTNQQRNGIPTTFDANVTLSALLRTSDWDTFEAIRDHTPEIIASGGIEGVLRVTYQAFAERAITMFECHVLSHYIGHRAYSFYKGDLVAAAKNTSNICLRGYAHGVEAEIVGEGDEGGGGAADFREKLYQFCALREKSELSGDCYHGAGHGFMRATLDIRKSLSLCNTLTGGPTNYVSPCHKGVFSEYTNLVGGIDGETGYKLSGGPPFKLATTPIKFCASFETPYQIPCALELNGLGFSPSSTLIQAERAFRSCNEKSYRLELQGACIQSVAAVFAQHSLPKNDTLTPSKYVFSLSSELRKAYIRGSATEIGQFILSGVAKDWRGFCGLFTKEDERQLCAQTAGQKWE